MKRFINAPTHNSYQALVLETMSAAFVCVGSTQYQNNKVKGLLCNQTKSLFYLVIKGITIMKSASNPGWSIISPVRCAKLRLRQKQLTAQGNNTNSNFKMLITKSDQFTRYIVIIKICNLLQSTLKYKHRKNLNQLMSPHYNRLKPTIQYDLSQEQLQISNLKILTVYGR